MKLQEIHMLNTSGLDKPEADEKVNYSPCWKDADLTAFLRECH